jgi:predicted pyridoxine 5'-phosphate oxidase superfamily flavin-nucleotide-binding protein
MVFVLGALPAGATVITASPVNFSAVEQSPFSGTVATFTDSDPSATPDQFVAIIDWGDGTKTSIGTITADGGGFDVSGQHTYAHDGTFSATVTVTEQEPGDGFSMVTDMVTVSDADVLSGTPRTFAAPSGVSFTTTVATFSDANTAAVPSDFTATINWGDATSSAGTVSGGGGTFQVDGTHTYPTTGTFSVMVTLTENAPGTATATVTSTAQVSAGLGVVASDFSTPEDTAFNGPVASFSDADTSRTAASFSATIDWGDGSPATAGTITGASGSFNVTGQHTYRDEGTFTVTVTVSEIAPAGATASDTGTATVTEADVLTGTPVNFAALSGIPFTGPVATFNDTNTASVAGDFVATIDWGDGQTSTGTVSGSGGGFTVSGTHTYASPGTFAVLVTLTDPPPGTATASVTGTATVTASLATIPTLDGWGLLALIAALSAVALYRLRRRGVSA